MDATEPVTTSTREGSRIIVAVSGDIDIASGPHVRTVGLAALESNPCELVVDLSAVSFMDSAGLGHVVWVLRAARGVAIPVRILVADLGVLRLFRMTGLETAFTVQQVA